jgi:hypothetical protein
MPEGEVFEEVSLVIRSLGESRFQVTLATEAQAEVTETFIPPSGSWRTEWGGAGSGWFRGGERDLDGGSLRELQEDSAREVGSALFEALLPGSSAGFPMAADRPLVRAPPSPLLTPRSPGAYPPPMEPPRHRD